MNNELFGTWSSPDQVLYALAGEYHERAEAYDRCVCTGSITPYGIAPITAEEHGLVNRNAMALFEELVIRAEAQGLTRAQLYATIRVYQERK